MGRSLRLRASGEGEKVHGYHDDPIRCHVVYVSWCPKPNWSERGNASHVAWYPSPGMSALHSALDMLDLTSSQIDRSLEDAEAAQGRDPKMTTSPF
jgi:hypothetical protein